MSIARILAASAAALVLMSPLCAQEAPEPLDQGVRGMLDESLTGPRPEDDTDKLWQAVAAAHGTAEPLIAALESKLAQDKNALGAARLLIGVMRYEGKAAAALRVAEAIDAELRTQSDALVRAELLDTLGRTKDAAVAYDMMLAGGLAPDLRQRILFRRALMGKDSATALEEFARTDGRTVDERNQAAVILGLRDHPAVAIELFEVRGESTRRFRQLIRLAEWAMAAKDHERAQQLAWEAVEVAKMRRDRRYAMTVAVSAYRAGSAIDALLQRFEQSATLGDDARQVWIDLLRDEGRVDDALRLFRDNSQGQWTASLRRQLLEICRDTGREEVLVSTFRDLMASEPGNLEWRSGLSRHYLETGDRDAAAAVWADFDRAAPSAQRQLEAAFAMRDLGLDELSLHFATRSAADDRVREQAWLFIVGLHLVRGQFEQASAALEQIEAQADPRGAVRAEVAGYYERMNRIDRAVAVLESMRAAHDGTLGTDLDMKFALLLSKVDREDEALEVWRSLWVRMRNTPRGRYVEDRMMTVAARLGVLAKIAIELEDRLEGDTVSTADVELLVRLYIKVGDSAAATEIIEEFLRRSQMADLEIIRRKATIFLACQDYVEYEAMIEQLVERDEENRIDHMRELLLSRLERGRRDQAIAQLPAMRLASGDDAAADEFEAGVYQLSGLTDLALTSYVKGLGRHPDRIDTHLLVATLMREVGAEMQAARRFQYLASSADKDDLFTIAIDGILNLRAVGNLVPDELVDWAMRLTLERLATRPEKFYLYRLAADLAEELGDLPMSIRTLTAGLPVAGERRTALLRELLGKLRSLDPNARVVFAGARRMRISDDWDPSQYVTLGRRLLGQGEIVPPQVYMDLATVFLKVDAVPDAMRTFSRAAELLDRSEVHRQAAEVLEGGKRYDAALSFYRRLLAVDATDVSLLKKIARLEEMAGRDQAAAAAYRRGVMSALQQTALQVHVEEEEAPDPDDPLAGLFAQRNIDAIQSALPKLVQGLLITMDRDQASSFVAELRESIAADLKSLARVETEGPARIESFRRLAASADVLRRTALCFRILDVADAVDGELLGRFPEDRDLAEQVVRYRSDRGFYMSAANLLAETSFATDPAIAWLAGDLDGSEGLIAPAAVAARVLPLLSENPERLREMLESVDAGQITVSNIDMIPLLLGACAAVGATEAAERIARAGIRAEADIPQRELFQRGEPGMRAIKLAGRVDPALRRSLTRAIVDRAAAQGAQAVVRLSYRLESKDDLQLDAATAERMLRETVLDRRSTSNGFVQGMELLRFVPTEQRPSLLRELYYAAPTSVRLSLLTEGAGQIEDPVPEPFVEWYGTVYPDALRKANELRRNSARYGSREETSSKALDRVRLESLLAVDGASQVRADLMSTLVELGERDVAATIFEDGLPDILAPNLRGGLVRQRGTTGPDRNHIRQLVQHLANHGLLRGGLAAVTRKLEDKPEHEAMRLFSWMAASKLPGQAKMFATALQAEPDNRMLLELAYEYHRDAGHPVEAVELLERLATGDEGKTWKTRLAAAYRSLGNYEAEQRVRDSLEPRVTGARRGGAAGRATAVAMARTVAVGGRARGNASRIATEILAIEDEAEARRRFREHWRGVEREERFAVIDRGPQVEVTPQTLTALADAPYLRDESERMLGLFEDWGKLGGTGLVPALFEAVIDPNDAEQALRALSAELDAGRAGNLEAGKILRLLGAEGVSSELRTETVTDLIGRIEVPDAGRLRQMAGELALLGRHEEAAVLFRLGVLTKTVDIYARRSRSLVETKAYLANVEKVLGPELGPATVLHLIDDFLATDDQLVTQTGPLEVLALETWKRLLTEEEANERAILLRARVDGGRYGRTFMRQSGNGAKLAAELATIFGSRGDFANAIEEFAELVRLPRTHESFAFARRVNRNRQPQQEVDQLLAADWGNRGDWLRLVGRNCLEWHTRRELLDPAGTLGAVGIALGTIGDVELGQAVRRALATLGASDSRAQMALAKVERAFGAETEAVAIETGLLTKRRLPIADHPRVLRQIGEREGAAAAIDAGEKALEYTAHSDVLEVMVELCDEAGQPERSQRWQQELESRRAEEAKKKRDAKNQSSQPRARR